MSNFYNVTTAGNFINSLRTKENAVLQTVTGSVQMPMIAFPSQTEWNAMDDDARFLWLINQERTARNLKPYSGVWPALDSVSQYYADYIRTNNVFSHNADGKSSAQRYTSVPGYNTCKDNSPYSENLYFTGSTVTYKTCYIIDAIAQFLYQDDCCAWGHRRVLLYKSPNDNSGKSGEEGLIGVGVSKGTYTNGGNTYAYSILLTFKFIDPCATWNYPTITGVNPTTLSGTTTLSIAGNHLYNMNKILLPDGQQLTFAGANTLLKVNIATLSVSGYITVSGLNGHKALGNVWLSSGTVASTPSPVVTTPSPVLTTPSPVATIPSSMNTTTSPIITTAGTLTSSKPTLSDTSTLTGMYGFENSENSISICPNPTDGMVYLHPPSPVEALDYQGRVVWTKAAPSKEIDLSSLPKGLYIIRVPSNKIFYNILKN